MPENTAITKTQRIEQTLIQLEENSDLKNASANEQFRAAELNFEIGKKKEALDLINLALENEANNAQYNFLKAKILKELGRVPEAMMYAENAISYNLDSPVFYAFLADLYIKADSISAARPYLQEVSNIAPELPSYRMAQARLMVKNQESAAAIQMLKSTYIPDRRNAEYFIILAEAYRNINILDSSFAFAAKAISMDPENIYFWKERAAYYIQKNEIDAAISTYAKLATLDPENTVILEKKAELSLAKNYYKSAYTIYLKIIELKPEEKSAYFRAGYCLEKIFDYKSAREFYLKAKLKFPDEKEFEDKYNYMSYKVDQFYRSTGI